MARWLSLFLDGASVLIFVVIGRSAHQHGVGLSGVISTLWPFAVGLGCAWLAEIALHRDPRQLRRGVEIAFVTVAIGMPLRVLAGQGTAVAFILVALGFLGATMAAWRLLATRWPRRSRSSAQ
jgi:Protein of unknown function (DUF3054)